MSAFGFLPPRVQGPMPGPRSRKLGDRLSAVESRNVVEPFGDLSVFWEEALGVNVRDADGNRLLDLTGAFGVALAGHRHPRVVEAIREGTGGLIHGMGDFQPSRERVDLLERLETLTPWPSTRGVLSSSGSEAVETALKTAVLATGKPGILAFRGGYHGLTMGALSTTERNHFRRPFRERLFQGVAFAPFPWEGGGRSPGVGQALEEVDRVLAEGGPDGSEVGAVLVEPIQGRAGVRVPPPGFLQEVARRARRAGALLIFDEIFTGLGRTGAVFAFEHEGVIPDLLCLGKGLGGGLPLSACLGPREVMDAWPPSRGEAIHTSTFLGHPLACRTASALLSVLAEEDLVERAHTIGETLAREARRRLSGVEPRAGLRGRGLFLGVTLRDSSGVYPLRGGGSRVAQRLLSRGIVTLPAGAAGNVVEITPPLVLTEELALYAAQELAKAVEDVLNEA